ncbi:MAG TPA: RNA methyltransferase [Polyangiaceae bacterium]|jgi:23S rRNA (guanosine2251-2'-O)-methyltransferase
MKFSGRRRWPERPPRLAEHPAGTEGLRLIAGLQPVREAIRVRRSALKRVAIEQKPSPTLEALARFATDQGVAEVVRAARADLDRWTDGAQHQGAVAWGPELELTAFETLLDDPNLLALALDGIQDPQNFGAVIRSAVGVADAAVVWGEHSSAPLSPATGRASAGALELAKLCRVPSLVGALNAARERGVAVIGLDAHAPQRVSELSLEGPTVLVVGNEHEGMGRGVRRACSAVGRLLTSGRIDSLNASVAAALALYEAANSRIKSRS